ncbi:hypothetical protein PtA15_6A128 [Puccinia triticina]|uniref:Uncharacterized protein n=1 Tax=Puccinia triticina TaxID=208348 RepID=A0ABY7CLC3_9BASI|nr:uncharacterized protein PtA15_6A128 [Puccinia triticina]WAQ85500.1 hypothetical protein PtA15_6A128 [Puccinia triticina]
MGKGRREGGRPRSVSGDLCGLARLTEHDWLLPIPSASETISLRSIGPASVTTLFASVTTNSSIATSDLLGDLGRLFSSMRHSVFAVVNFARGKALNPRIDPRTTDASSRAG